MEMKLKPCPFCGGRGRVIAVHDGYRIVCAACGARGSYAIRQSWHDNKFVAQCQAARAWNERWQPQATSCEQKESAPAAPTADAPKPQRGALEGTPSIAQTEEKCK